MLEQPNRARMFVAFVVIFLVLELTALGWIGRKQQQTQNDIASLRQELATMQETLQVDNYGDNAAGAASTASQLSMLTNRLAALQTDITGLKTILLQSESDLPK